MYLIAGLGNPGREFEMTRHNIGFEVIDYIAAKYKVKVKKLKFKGLYQKTELEGEDVILLKPQTYMNLSGESIRDFAEFFKIPPEKIIVISDDVYLDEGRIRIRKSGSAGGHNGLKSIIYQLNSEDFIRIRIGVGKKEGDEQELADFVLSRFTKEQIPLLEQAIINAADAVSEILKNGAESAMNRFNGI